MGKKYTKGQKRFLRDTKAATYAFTDAVYSLMQLTGMVHAKMIFQSVNFIPNERQITELNNRMMARCRGHSLDLLAKLTEGSEAAAKAAANELVEEWGLR